MISRRPWGWLLAAVVATSGLGVGYAPMAAQASGRSIVVTPSSGLVSGQTVQLTGSGFPANTDLVGIECLSGAPDPSQCGAGDNTAFITTDEAGTFTTPFTLARTLLVEGGFVDCAPAKCEMYVASIEDFTSDQTTAPLAFDPHSALPKTTLKLKPATDLADGQGISISGAGYQPGAFVDVTECVIANFSCGPQGEEQALSNGRYFTGLDVRRIITDSMGTPIDSATAAGTCVIISYDETNFDYHATRPLEFDPTLPPPPPPTLKITPNTNLPYYARVTVSGKHWAPNDFLFAVESASATSPACAFIDVPFLADGSGQLVGQPMLQRELPDLENPDNPPVDCAAPGAKCMVFVQSLNDNSTASAAISFDPDAPIPPPPSAKVTPAGPYRNDQIVKIKGRNFAPNAAVQIDECGSTADGESCYGTDEGSGMTTATGGLVSEFQVARVIEGFEPGDNIDSASKTAQCTLQITSEGGAEVDVALHFSKHGSAADASPHAAVAHRTAQLKGWLVSTADRLHPRLRFATRN